MLEQVVTGCEILGQIRFDFLASIRRGRMRSYKCIVNIILVPYIMGVV